MSAAQIKRLEGSITSAERRRNAYVQKRYPRGTPIRWEKGGHQQVGHVERNNGWRLLVYNANTGNERWIFPSDILDM